MSLKDLRSWVQDKAPNWFVNGLRWAIGIEFWLHAIELVSAVYEEAWITASLLVVSTLILCFTWIFLPDGHNHQVYKGNNNKETLDVNQNGKD